MISVLRKTRYLPSPFPLEEREKFLRKNWKLLDLTLVGLVITAESEFVSSKFTADGSLTKLRVATFRDKVDSQLFVFLNIGI